jgi:hypothetical protein
MFNIEPASYQKDADVFLLDIERKLLNGTGLTSPAFDTRGSEANLVLPLQCDKNLVDM